MDLYGKYDRSLPQKGLMFGLELCILAITYWLLFLGGYGSVFHSGAVVGNFGRHLLLFIFSCIVFIRTSFTFFYLLKRSVPWQEAVSVPFAFAIYYVGYAHLGYGSVKPIDTVDVFAIVLFLFGSFLNTYSELQRDRWKKIPSNKGHLYTSGLFRYSMHINYFGDILWVTAYAIVTRNLYSAAIPVMIFFFFAFYNAPKLDRYLLSKYGNEFEEYSKRTKKLVPFV